MIVDPSANYLAPMLFNKHVVNMGMLSSFDVLG